VHQASEAARSLLTDARGGLRVECKTLSGSRRLPAQLTELWLSRAWCREGGFFKAELKFPEDFPNSPPEMKFVTPMWHPNSACPGGA
jgi:hypothetical protein